jgi:hypothetical protein
VNLAGLHPTLRSLSLFTLPPLLKPSFTALHYYPTSTLIWSHSYTTHPWELAITLQGRGSYSPMLTNEEHLQRCLVCDLPEYKWMKKSQNVSV